MTLEGRTALVTGAGRGIGRGIALRLAREGAAVIVGDVDEGNVTQVAGEIRAAGGRALPLLLDVRTEAAVNAAVEQARSESGPITILVNNAGVYRSTPLLESSLEDWYLSLAVNLTGQLLCARAVAPDMIAQRWGRIINQASMMSYIAFGSDAAYCASKAGVLGLTRSMSIDLAPYNICVNALCPGNIMSPMLEMVDQAIAERDHKQPGQFLSERPKEIPLGRLGTPDDIAGMVAFLCGPDGGYITGQALHVNGGLYQT
ncbi:MAG TPA: SDR family NAD(P)-dependent oxidoreductase [Ktedonobacteraceae bacterium]|jgi:NAD(P)-dependent dehydrogenase (short-subunit alcohol dehydrogenase family)|nr:SDR family NAD(P)-dependent oxidoreductase [Ktedonobacteraceae bacterium]